MQRPEGAPGRPGKVENRKALFENMDELGIIQYIANYGMPAILCIVLLVLLNNEQKQRKEDNEKTRETISELKDVIKDNTNLLQRLLDQWK